MFSLSTRQVYTQQIENVDFTVTDNFIIVTYDLTNCPSRKTYDIKLKIVSDNGTIIPTTITGDIFKVNQGNNKNIKWDVLSDNIEIKGNIQAIVEISKTYSTEIVGGPSNAFLSMVWPGWGTRFVLYKKKEDERTLIPNYIMCSYGVALIYGYLSKVKSDEAYSKYHSATDQGEMNDFYKTANEENKNFQIALGVASAIWILDVWYVFQKGFENREEQLNNYTQENQSINFYVSNTSNSFQIGFVKKF